MSDSINPNKVRKMRVFSDGKWNCYYNEKWHGLSSSTPRNDEVKELYKKALEKTKAGVVSGSDNRKANNVNYFEIHFDLSKPKNLSRLLCQQTKDRFEKKVQKSENDCWLWQSNTTENGYGRMSIDNTVFLAHRLSYIFSHEIHPGDDFVLHHCDNPPCVNPEHLYLGDYSDNIQDAYDRNRRTVLSGNNSAVAKITRGEAEEIKERYQKEDVRQQDLGEEYGITGRQVSSIVNGESWS